MGELIRVPISKAGKAVTFDVDTDELNAMFDANPDLMKTLIAEGLKTILNSRMSKLAAPTKLEGKALEDNKVAALEAAAKNLKDFADGLIGKKGASASKAAGVDRAVMTEAIRLAKDVVKNEIRKAGMKISHVAPKDITEAAKALVAGDEQYINDAKIALAERANIKSAVDIGSLIKESPNLVAKAEKAKAERKDQLSAKQAGLPKKSAAKVPPRRPEAGASHSTH